MGRLVPEVRKQPHVCHSIFCFLFAPLQHIYRLAVCPHFSRNCQGHHIVESMQMWPLRRKVLLGLATSFSFMLHTLMHSAAAKGNTNDAQRLHEGSGRVRRREADLVTVHDVIESSMHPKSIEGTCLLTYHCSTLCDIGCVLCFPVCTVLPTIDTGDLIIHDSNKREPTNPNGTTPEMPIPNAEPFLRIKTKVQQHASRRQGKKGLAGHLARACPRTKGMKGPGHAELCRVRASKKGSEKVSKKARE